MKSGIYLEIFSLRWWAIIGVAFLSLSLFIWFDYANSFPQNNVSSQPKGQTEFTEVIFSNPINPANNNIQKTASLTPIFIRSSIGFLMVFILLSLISARSNKIPQQNEQNIINLLKDNLPFGVAIWSEKGELIGCNSLYRNKLNLTFMDVEKNKSYVEIMNKIRGKNGFKIVSDEELVRQIEIINNEGSTIFIDERPFGENGFISIISDISDKIKLEKELANIKKTQRSLTSQLRKAALKAEAASRSKTSFLAHLSHDVRTPLTHIIGFAELIQHQNFGPIGDKKYLEYIETIKSSGEKLLISFSEILELAQLEGGDISLKNEDLLLSDLIKNIIKKYRPRAKKAGIKLKYSACEETLLHADRMCIERMIGNIVENSIQFTKKGGEVNINAWKADDGVILEISDNGIGMSKERIADLSEPFILGDAAFTREGGVGVGIAISRAIAELNGGELVIDSTPSVGTTVAISLPLTAEQNIENIKAA